MQRQKWGRVMVNALAEERKIEWKYLPNQQENHFPLLSLNRDESKGLIHNKRYLLSWPHKARGHRLFYRRQEALFLEKHTEHA